jgi:hypothetical protein
LDLGRFVIVSASPELFFERTGDDLLLRPRKGTATRGRDLAADRQRAAALRTSPKERAENVMIVDLIRNDVARVAEIAVSVSRIPRAVPLGYGHRCTQGEHDGAHPRPGAHTAGVGPGDHAARHVS